MTFRCYRSDPMAVTNFQWRSISSLFTSCRHTQSKHDGLDTYFVDDDDDDEDDDEDDDYVNKGLFLKHKTNRLRAVKSVMKILLLTSKNTLVSNLKSPIIFPTNESKWAKN